MPPPHSGARRPMITRSPSDLLNDARMPERLDQAAIRIESLEAESRRFNHDYQLVPLLVMKSVLHSNMKRVRDALSILTEAVGLAWPGRRVLPFIEGGAPVAELLRQLPG